MLKISGHDGKVYNLSEEVYEVLVDHQMAKNYKAGDKVRLISGIGGQEVPGYHQNPAYVTACRDGAAEALFIGFRREHLSPAPPKINAKRKTATSACRTTKTGRTDAS